MDVTNTQSEQNEQTIYLTPKQLQVYLLLIEGVSTKNIASFYGINIRTIESHICNIYRKIPATERKNRVILLKYRDRIEVKLPKYANEGKGKAQAHKNEILKLYKFDNVPVKAIAERFGLSESGVRNVLKLQNFAYQVA